MAQSEAKTETKSRLLARLIWPLVKAGEYQTIADLTDALKTRCAQLRITWTNDDINAAYVLIESNTPLLPAPARRVDVADPPATDPVIDRQFAADFLAELRYRVRTVPPAAWRDAEADDRAEDAARKRAAEMGIEL